VIALPATNLRVSVTDIVSLLNVVSGADFTLISPWTAEAIAGSPVLNAVSFVNNTTGWTVGNTEALLMTGDGEVTWTSQAGNPGLPVNPSINWMAVSFVDPNYGWVAGYDGSFAHIENTTDGGVHWNVAHAEVTIPALQPTGIAFATTSNGWLVSASGNISQTTNGGGSWLAPYVSGLPLNSISFTSGTTNGWVVGANGVILATTDGTTWNSQTSGVTVALNGVCALDSGRVWAVGGVDASNYGTIVVTVNGGTNWTSQTSGTMENLNAVSFYDAYDGWAVGNGGALLQYAETPSARRGKSRFLTSGVGAWSVVPTGLSTDLKAIAVVNGSGCAIGSGGTVLRYDTSALPPGTGVYSTQYGSLWNLVSVPAHVGDANRDVLFPLSDDPAWNYVPGTGYVSGEHMAVGTGYWLKFPAAQAATFLGTPVVFDSLSLEQGWNLIGSISSPVAVASIVSSSPGLVTSQFFGYNHGYVESDTIQPGKAYWVKAESAGGIILNSGHGTAHKSNVLKIKRTTELPPPPPFTTAVATSVKPKQFALKQNYPNPFNPTTVIQYDLPKAAFVKLSIYDILGQQVRTLVNEMEQAGYKSVSFNGNNLPSGLYFYRISAGAFTDVKKMILIR
jgi:photosystem II stability/assembly factor-like uncharacterized protein